MTPADAVTLLAANFADSIAPHKRISRNLPAVLAPLRIAGGAVYDALAGLAAQGAGVVLITRDARAIPTYTAVGARIGIVG